MRETKVKNMRKAYRITAYRVCLLAACGAAFAGTDTCPPVDGADTHPTFDATRLKEGRFTYRTTLKGEPLDETVIEIRHVGAQFLISMNAPEIDQGWKAKVEKSFAPVSASLSMRGKKGPYQMTHRPCASTTPSANAGTSRNTRSTPPTTRRVTC